MVIVILSDVISFCWSCTQCWQLSHLSSALCATLWQSGPSACGGGWSTETESGRSAASCSAPTASSPGPTPRRTTCRYVFVYVCVCVSSSCDPTVPLPALKRRSCEFVGRNSHCHQNWSLIAKLPDLQLQRVSFAPRPLLTDVSPLLLAESRTQCTEQTRRRCGGVGPAAAPPLFVYRRC